MINCNHDLKMSYFPAISRPGKHRENREKRGSANKQLFPILPESKPLIISGFPMVSGNFPMLWEISSRPIYIGRKKEGMREGRVPPPWGGERNLPTSKGRDDFFFTLLD